MSTTITTPEALWPILAVASEEAEPVVVREGFRVWTLTEDEGGQWWGWSWREEGEEWRPRRVEELTFPLTLLYRPDAAADTVAGEAHGPDCIPAPFGDCINHPLAAPAVDQGLRDRDALMAVLTKAWLTKMPTYSGAAIGAQADAVLAVVGAEVGTAERRQVIAAYERQAAEVEALRAENERLRESAEGARRVTRMEERRAEHATLALEVFQERNPCICDPNPETTDGPQEDCPEHGRPYAYWVDRADAVAAERDAALARESALRAGVEALRDQWVTAWSEDRTFADDWSERYAHAVQDCGERLHDLLVEPGGEG